MRGNSVISHLRAYLAGAVLLMAGIVVIIQPQHALATNHATMNKSHNVDCHNERKLLQDQKKHLYKERKAINPKDTHTVKKHNSKVHHLNKKIDHHNDRCVKKSAKKK